MNKLKASTEKSTTNFRRNCLIILPLVAALLIWGLLLRKVGLGAVLQVWRQTTPGLLMLLSINYLLAISFRAAAWLILSEEKLPIFRLGAVMTLNQATAKIIPLGAGELLSGFLLGRGGKLLTKLGLVSAERMLQLGALIFLLIILAALAPHQLPATAWISTLRAGGVLAVLALFIVSLGFLLRRRSLLGKLWHFLSLLKNRLVWSKRVAVVLAVHLVLWMINAVVLYLVFAQIGEPVNFIGLSLAFFISVLVGTVGFLPLDALSMPTLALLLSWQGVALSQSLAITFFTQMVYLPLHALGAALSFVYLALRANDPR